MVWTLITIIICASSILCILIARIWRAILLMKDSSKGLYEKKKNIINAIRYSGYALLIIGLILVILTEAE